MGYHTTGRSLQVAFAPDDVQRLSWQGDGKLQDLFYGLEQNHSQY